MYSYCSNKIFGSVNPLAETGIMHCPQPFSAESLSDPMPPHYRVRCFLGST